MNRRELFQRVVGAAAATGISVKASAFGVPATRPAMVVFSTDESMSHATCARLAQSWEDFARGTLFDGVKAIVLTRGMTLSMVDETGHVIAPSDGDARPAPVTR